jgi:hypothetical protein
MKPASKKAVLLTALLLAAAGYVCLQTTAPLPDLATYMPAGALLYLQAPDFGHLLRDWNDSQVKTDWLASANYEVFSRSNLFTKLKEVYGQYGEAAGFAPELANIVPIAGTDSALALYDIREVEFLYLTRLPEASLTQSALWRLRDKFEQRQAGGVPFYLRTDAASKRTVAFAFNKGYLILATRDDLVAQSLELMAGSHGPTLAAERWSQAVLAQAPARGDVRLVMDLESLVASVPFRSYWIQRNRSDLKQYWAGVADVKLSPAAITETRVFLRTPDSNSAAPSAAIAGLMALAPPEAGMYKIAPVADPAAAASLIVGKLIAPVSQRFSNGRFAPPSASPDNLAGSEAELETRIDEQPLAPDAGLSDSVAATRAMLEKGGAQAILWLQASAAIGGTFFELPSAIVVQGSADWDANAVRGALGDAAGRLWTTSRLGAEWTAATAGNHAVEGLNGLGKLMFTTRGRLLFLSNDAAMLAAVLDRPTAPPAAGALTCAAAFRHLRERPTFERTMAALDFGAGGTPGPKLFSANIASLSRALAQVAEVRVTEEEKGAATLQTVVYRLGQ